MNKNSRFFGSAFDNINNMEMDSNTEANLSVTNACLEVI